MKNSMGNEGLPPFSPALLTISPLTITYVCVVRILPVRDGFYPKTESSPPETSYTTHIPIRRSDVYFELSYRHPEFQEDARALSPPYHPTHSLATILIFIYFLLFY
jgi:hypothetical protein